MSESLQPSLKDQNHRLSLDEVLNGLIADGLLIEQDTAKLKAAGRWRGGQDLHPLVVVANQKLTSRQTPHNPLTLEALTEWLARYAGLPHQHIDPLKIDVAAVGGLIAYAYAHRYRILPLDVTPDTVTIATSEPFLTDWITDLRHLLRRDIRRVVANPLDINRYLMEFYGLSRSVQGAEDARTQQQAAGSSNIFDFEQLWELGQSGELGAEDKPVVQIVDWILQYAFEQRASDIHLEPRRERAYVRFRIDGVLHRVYEMPPPVMTAVTSRIKILGRMNIADRRRPQDGRIKTRTPSGNEIELRLSTMPTAFGEKCVLRIFDPDTVVKSFAELGFAPREIDIWQSMIDHPHGIILVTGPTGSGKTTTLYSTLKHLARPEINLCTVEDPIEMIAPELNQMQVQPAIDLTFAQGIRTLLRQDPDIIMVGEVRDLETAQMAVQAALTGHLVFSTLHTNDAPSAITRLIDIGVPHYLIQSTLVGVMAQRLVRTLCPHCKSTQAVDPALWQALSAPWKLPQPEQMPKAVGCRQCRQTGYLGRTAIYELLPIAPAVQAMIKADSSAMAIRKRSYSEGMRPLRISAAAQVLSGRTTVEEVLKVIPPNEEQ